MAHLAFLALTTLLFIQTYLLARRIDRRALPSQAVLFAAVAGLAEIVVLLQLNPARSGLALRVVALLLIQGALLWWFRIPRAGAAVGLRAREVPPLEAGAHEVFSQEPGERPDPARALLWIPVIVVLLQMLTYLDPPAYHDGLTYHLAFAVEWMRNGTLDPPLQAYGDIAPPFYPLNSSLLYLWNLALPGSDFWARSTQAPFVVLVAAATLALCRAMDGRFATALVAILALFAMPQLRAAYREQGNDVILAGFLLTAVAFLVDIHRSGSRVARAGFPLAISLALGTKFLAVAYAPPLVLSYLWLVRKTRPFAHGLWLLVCVLGLAAFPYVRNWHVTGSALFPATFDVPGLRASMAAFGGYDVYRVSYGGGCRTASDLSEIGATSLLILTGALIYCATRRRRLLRSPALWLFAMAAWSAIAFFAVVPYRHCRLLLFPVLLLIPLAAAAVGERRILDTAFATTVGARLSRLRMAFAVTGGVLLLALCARAPEYEREKYDRWASMKIAGRRYGQAWNRVQTGPMRIAMSATQNMPYPLYGRRFENTVFFVPADGTTRALYYGLGSTTLSPFSSMTEREWTRAIHVLKPDVFWSAADLTTGAFGKEDEWARRHPELFELIHADADARIYRVHPAPRGRA